MPIMTGTHSYVTAQLCEMQVTPDTADPLNSSCMLSRNGSVELLHYYAYISDVCMIDGGHLLLMFWPVKAMLTVRGFKDPRCRDESFDICKTIVE